MSSKGKYRNQHLPDYGQIWGRIPPQSRDLEEGVLGALMIEKNLLDELLDIFFPSIFYVDSHMTIAKVILDMHQSREAIDILTVTEKLRQTGELESVGGAFYVTQLTNRVASSAHIRYHLNIIFQKYLQREIIRNATEALRDSFEDTTDVFELIGKQKDFFNKIDDPVIKMKQMPLVKQVDNTIRMMELASGRIESTFGTATGLKNFDKTTSGLCAGEVTVIAARPGMGKTALAIALARRLREQGIPTDFYSFESPYQMVLLRMMAQDLRIPLIRLRMGNVPWLDIKNYRDKLVKQNFTIEDTSDMYCEELEARLRMRFRSNGTQVSFIDYLQLLHVRDMPRNANRENEVSQISRMIKRVTLDTGMHIIPLSQLNRSVETRGGDKRPQLGDLRESGSIEQDADNVVLIYRPEVYKIMVDQDGYSTQNIAIIDHAKNRNGPTKEYELMYTPELLSFDEFPDNFQKKYEPNAAPPKGKRRRRSTSTVESPRDITEPTREDDLPF